MTAITLELPDPILVKARQAAQLLQRSVEDRLTDMLAAVLPSTAGVPVELQTELTQMTWLDNQQLWSIARSQMSERDQERMRQISQLDGERPLMPDEEQEQAYLRNEYGSVTLRKARAYSLLSIRGGKPLLDKV